MATGDGEAVIRTGAKRKRQELQGEGKQEGHKKFKGEGDQVWTWKKRKTVAASSAPRHTEEIK